MNVRITQNHYREMRRCTAASFLNGLEYPPETGCILLVSRSNHASYPSLIVSEVLPPVSGELAEQEHDGIVFSSNYLRRALLRARELDLAGFLTVHTHPGSDTHVSFSPYDDGNDPALMANLYDLQPGGVFGSVVLGKRSAAARLWHREGDGYSPLNNLIIVGEVLERVPLNGSPLMPPPEAAAIFDRSLAVTSQGALANLSKMRVGVVGASGTGSLVLELLVRAGVGEVVIYEFDQIEDANLNRILHSRRIDAQANAKKSERIAQALAETGLPTKMTCGCGGDIRLEDVALDLRGCDLVIGCVDRDWPRLVLCEIAYQYLIPYIDLGTEIGMSTDEVQSLDSRVSYVAPGRPCLVCSKIVTTERVRLEGLENNEQKRVLAMGYSKDIHLVAPSVMDLNMRAASYAVLVLRHLMQPFLDSPLPTHIKEALTNFSIKAVRHDIQADCLICGASGRSGRGDSIRLTTKRLVA
jgi:hypothetical protein